MTEPDKMTGHDDYDEFGMLGDNAAEAGLALDAMPAVARTVVHASAAGKPCHAIAWGDAEPELVLLHGGGQNAHTWDTVALALGRPLLAVDLPGHGHSDRRQDRDYGPWRNAEAVASVIEQAAPRRAAPSSGCRWAAYRSSGSRPPARTWCAGRSSSTSPPTAASAHARWRRAERGAVALVSGPPAYESFEAMAAAAVAATPGRARGRRSSAGCGTTPGGCPTAAGHGATTCSASARRPSATTPGCGRTCRPSPCRCCWCSAPTRRSPATEDVAEFRRRLPAAGVEVVRTPGTPSRAASRWRSRT